MYIKEMSFNQKENLQKLIRQAKEIYFGEIEKEKFFVIDNELVFVHTLLKKEYTNEVFYQDKTIFNDFECTKLLNYPINSKEYKKINKIYQNYMKSIFKNYDKALDEYNGEKLLQAFI